MNTRKKPTIIDYLAFLSVKHNIFLADLFRAMVSARKQKKARCQDLKFEYRGSIKDDAIFLITKENSVLSQFRVPERFLQRQNICFESWMDTGKINRQLRKQNSTSNYSTLIQDLRDGMRKVNVQAEVLETAVSNQFYTRYGNTAMMTDMWIEDETGKIKFCLWNEQAKSVAVGDIIQIKNALVFSFKGERQLRLERFGLVNVLHNQTTAIKKTSSALACP